MRSFGLRLAIYSLLSLIAASLWVYAVFSDTGILASTSWVNGTARKGTLIGCTIVVFLYCAAIHRMLLYRSDRVFIVRSGLAVLVIAVIGLVIVRKLIYLIGINPAPTNFWLVGKSILIPVLIAFGPAYLIYRLKRFRENPLYRQWFLEGRGGSAEWAGPATYEHRQIRFDRHMNWPYFNEYGVMTDEIFLGRSQFDDDPFSRLVGIKDDTHMLTIGVSGSGKSTTAVWPNLAMYKGSVIVFDPKGEHARQTYMRRCGEYWKKDMNIQSRTYKRFPAGECHMLDPFNANKGTGLPMSFYNPLSEIDIDDENIREKTAAIADGCVNPESSDNQHFEEWARDMIQGLIIHVLSRYPKEKHNLPFVLDLFHGFDPDTKVADPERFKELLIDMMTNDACGGLAQQTASKLMEMGDRERGSVLSTAARSLKWIGDPAMRKHLMSSDFSFSDIGNMQRTKSMFDGKVYDTPKTVYIVLPDGQMKEQMRWVRTLISLGIVIMQGRDMNYVSPTPTLFILDEFPKLGGKIEAIAEGFAFLRSYKIKLWPFIQNIDQLQKDYPDRWGGIIGNSTLQVFGVGSADFTTADMISRTLGGALNTRTERGKGLGMLLGGKVVHQAAYNLLTPDEVMNKFGKRADVQMVRASGGLPMRLTRLTYKPMTLDRTTFDQISYEGLKGHFEDW